METPAIPMPKSAQEQEILGKLSAVRDQLLLLKRDRTKYIRSQDVVEHYEELVDLVKQLNEIRKHDQEHVENRGIVSNGILQTQNQPLTKSAYSGQGSRELFPTHITFLHDNRADERRPCCIRIDLDGKAAPRPLDRSWPLLAKRPRQSVKHPQQAGWNPQECRSTTLTVPDRAPLEAGSFL